TAGMRGSGSRPLEGRGAKGPFEDADAGRRRFDRSGELARIRARGRDRDGRAAHARIRRRRRDGLAGRALVRGPHQGLCREARLMRLDVLKAMNAARRGRRAGAVVTRLSDGDQRFVEATAIDADPLAAELESALRMGKSGVVAVDGVDYFL